MPGKLIEVSMLTDKDESHRNHVYAISPTGRLRTLSTIKGRVTGVLHPAARLAQQTTVRAL
jgi:hypothetical protein